MSDIAIRPTTPADSAAIAALISQLGYPVSAAEVPARLGRLSADDRAVVLLAVRADVVVGVATAHVLAVLNRPRPVAWLTMLVVEESARGSGAGRQLVRAVEVFALEQDCERLSVTTHTDRADARAFYVQIGMQETGRRFGKALNPELPLGS